MVLSAQGLDASFPNATIAETIKGFAALGYRYLPADPEDPLYGSLSRGGIKMDALLYSYGSIPPLEAFDLRVSLVLPCPVRQKANRDGWVSAGEVTVYPTNDKERLLQAGFLFESVRSQRAVKAKLDAIWRDAARVAKAQKGRLQSTRERNRAARRHRDHDVLTLVDRDTIFDIVDAWGWPYVPTMNMGNPTDWKWGAFRTKGSIFMLLYGWDAKHPARLFYAWSGLDFEKGGDPARHVADQRRRLPGVGVSAERGGITYRMTFELSRGMALGEIRRRFEAVARAQAPLRRRYGATPQNAF